jgi:hypothetical protein
MNPRASLIAVLCLLAGFAAGLLVDLLELPPPHTGDYVKSLQEENALLKQLVATYDQERAETKAALDEGK